MVYWSIRWSGVRTGGGNQGKRPLSSLERFSLPRANHRSTVLENGNILYTGGVNTDPTGFEFTSAAVLSFR